MFVAGSSSDQDASSDQDGGIQSRSTGTVATMRYSRVVFSLGHSHSFGYGEEKRSSASREMGYREMPELDDDYIEWNGFKVFHIRDSDAVTDSTEEWNSLTWSERSLKKAAKTAWSNHSKGRMSVGAVIGTVIGVTGVAIAVVSIVGYVMLRRAKRQFKQEDTASLER